MSPENIERYGDELFDALMQRATVPPLTERAPDITIADAYRIQQRMVGRRVEAGENIVGKKIGVTSRAVQELLGVDQPDFGQLTSSMGYFEGETVPLAGLIQPRAEVEVAFVLKRDLQGPGVTATDVLWATDHVVPCFEIVDSRIADWNIRIQDTVADNASCGLFMIGDTKATLTKFDLTLAGMVLECNGKLAGTSAGAAVQGGPVNAVVWLANTLGRLGLALNAGDIILSGAQSTLVPVAPGDVLNCCIGGLGTLEIRFAVEEA